MAITPQMQPRSAGQRGRMPSLFTSTTPLLQGHGAKHSIHPSSLIFFNLFMCVSWKGGMCWCVIAQPRAPYSQRSHFISAPSPSSSRGCLYLTTFPSIPVPGQLKITAPKLNLEAQGATGELLGFFIFNVAQQVHSSSLSNCTFRQHTTLTMPTPERDAPKS